MSNDIDDRIKAARDEYKKDYEPQGPEASDGTPGANAGYEFLAYVISGGIVGYAVDFFAKTLPWGLILFIILGFVLGVIRANKRMRESD